MNEQQREVLLDILANTETPEKATITLDLASKTVTIVYEHMDAEWFREMVEASSKPQPPD